MIKPMLFSTDMVRAILEDRKTVTRRVVKPQPDGRPVPMTKDSCWPGCFAIQGTEKVVRPPYQPGDILWVRETWAKIWYADQNGCTHYDQPMYYYAADGTPDVTLVDEDGFEKDDQRIRWRPSIHMPREAARIFLRVTNVQPERLQDINGLHAKEEGCEGYVHINPLYGCPETVHNFKALWDSTIKPADRPTYGWDANPWVWVIEFERCEKPRGFV